MTEQEPVQDHITADVQINGEGLSVSLYRTVDGALELADEGWLPWAEIIGGDSEAWAAFDQVPIEERKIVLQELLENNE